jgi:hypothetical protein
MAKSVTNFLSQNAHDYLPFRALTGYLSMTIVRRDKSYFSAAES